MTPEDLTRRLEAYLALRTVLGFPMRTERVLLEDFLRFALTRGGEDPLRARTAVAWACQEAPNRGRATHAQRLSVVRGFLRHLRAAEPSVEVPDSAIIGRGPRRPRPYLFRDSDVLRLMEAAKAIRPRGSLRPLVYATLVGLLAATGLRISEALALTTADLLLELDPARLRIAETKFGKTRLVPLHPTAAEMLRAFDGDRRRLRFDAVTDVFFCSEAGARIEPSLAWRTFRCLCEQLGLDPEDGSRRPSWHALRHTFAVRRLTTWYEEGEDVASLIPNLAVYLGHVSPQETYWYLTATPTLLGLASDAFERYAGGER